MSKEEMVKSTKNGNGKNLVGKVGMANMGMPKMGMKKMVQTFETIFREYQLSRIAKILATLSSEIYHHWYQDFYS